MKLYRASAHTFLIRAGWPVSVDLRTLQRYVLIGGYGKHNPSVKLLLSSAKPPRVERGLVTQGFLRKLDPDEVAASNKYVSNQMVRFELSGEAQSEHLDDQAQEGACLVIVDTHVPVRLPNTRSGWKRVEGKKNTLLMVRCTPKSNAARANKRDPERRHEKRPAHEHNWAVGVVQLWPQSKLLVRPEGGSKTKPALLVYDRQLGLYWDPDGVTSGNAAARDARHRARVLELARRNSPEGVREREEARIARRNARKAAALAAIVQASADQDDPLIGMVA